jgi:hypothetical protein
MLSIIYGLYLIFANKVREVFNEPDWSEFIVLMNLILGAIIIIDIYYVVVKQKSKA